MDFKLTRTDRFPVGTSVAVYPASARREGAAPVGSAVDTQTMAADGLTFTGLQPQTAYVAYAKVGDEHRYISFLTPAEPPPQGGGAAELEANGKGFVFHGDDANVERPTGFASVEWHGSVEPNNAVDNDTWIDTSA